MTVGQRFYLLGDGLAFAESDRGDALGIDGDKLFEPGRVVGDCDDARSDLDADPLVLAIPLRIQTIKAEDPSLAMRWRTVTRTAFEAYLPRGYIVTDALRGDVWTGLVLERRATPPP